MRFIINRRSGRSIAPFGRAIAFASRQGATFALTLRPGHATELARQALADGCEVVVAVGGDGTVNEVASALVNTGATLGLVPVGSGNGLGRHLGVHGHYRHIYRTLVEGQARVIDTGLADGRPFFTMAGLGFEADVAERFNQLKQRGFLSYLRTSAALLRGYQLHDCVLRHDGGSETIRAFTVAVANSDQYGNNARIAPGARVDDGRLNLTVIPAVHAGNALPLLCRLFAGTLGRSPGVVLRSGASFVVERPGPGLIHTDGETHAAGARVEFRVQPASLRVLVPPGDGRAYSSP